MCVIYVVEQNVKVSSSCVYHRLYFTHKLKNPIIKPHRKISKEPAANYSSRFWGHSSPTLFTIADFNTTRTYHFKANENDNSPTTEHLGFNTLQMAAIPKMHFDSLECDVTWQRQIGILGKQCAPQFNHVIFKGKLGRRARFFQARPRRI